VKKSAIWLSGKSVKAVQPPLEKYSALPAGQIICMTSRRPTPTEGRFAIVTNAGWDAVDVAALGAQLFAGRFSVTEQQRAGRTALQRLGQESADSTWSVEILVEVAAYGEVVWSWHPLLMLSPRRRVGPTGLGQVLIRRGR
jgi:hypothetical protein